MDARSSAPWGFSWMPVAAASKRGRAFTLCEWAGPVCLRSRREQFRCVVAGGGGTHYD